MVIPNILLCLEDCIVLVLRLKDFEKKNILISKVIIMLSFMDDISRNGFITIEAFTELNRKSLDLAGLRQTYRFRT